MMKSIKNRVQDQRLKQLLRPVQTGMEQMRACVEAQLNSEYPAVAEMTEHLGSFHGKQLRAALVLLAGEASGNHPEELPQVASVIEMIHLATLVHDDVLDGAQVRRRVACVHRRWDNQVAVLLGDLLYARAFHLSTTLSSPLVSQRLAAATQRICEGEIVQADSRLAFEMELRQAEWIASAKTATLYSAACELGAGYGAQEGSPWPSRLAAFGEQMGLAFQIVDDVLDLVGEEDTVGKSVGNDVDDGKVTLAVLHTYACANDSTRAAMEDAYTAEGVGDRRAALRAACDLGPGVHLSLERARELVFLARHSIEDLPDCVAKEALMLLGDYVLERKW